MENIKKTILVLLIVNLAVVFYFGLNVLNVKKELQTIKTENASYYQNVLNQIISQGNHLSSSIEHSIQQSNDVVTDYSFNVSEENYQAQTALVTLDITLKESSPNSTLTAQYKALDKEEQINAPLALVSGLGYRAQITLPIENNYSVYIYESTSDGGMKQLNYGEMSLHLYNDVYQFRAQSIGSGSSRTSDHLTIHHEFTLRNEEQDAEAIDQILLQAKTNDLSTVAEFDITDKLIVRNSSPQLDDHYRVAIASGQISSDVTLEEFRLQNEASFDSPDDQNASKYYFIENTFHMNELGKVWSQYADGEIIFTLLIKFKDGMEVEL